jgi:DNA anti-recombination protein RmuC
VGFFGLGLDNQDGHQRLTRSEHFFLVGGSSETHERMQDTAIRFTEALQRRGKELQDTSVEEVLEIFKEIDD